VQDLPADDNWITEHRRRIGDRIRAERKRQHLSQDAVWMAARINRWTYQRVERGEEATLGTLLRITRVLDMRLGDLDE
jgi:transcriptional regulator with XRE-family HTH domain